MPTLEKFGKTCQLLLGPEDLHLVQTSQDTDGMQITARWAAVSRLLHIEVCLLVASTIIHMLYCLQGVLFEPETYKTISKNHNLIAFVFEVPLLLRVLKAAGNNAADSLEVKLAMRTMSGGPSSQSVSRPYLTFASKGHNLNMTQDLPVSKPYTAARKPFPPTHFVIQRSEDTRGTACVSGKTDTYIYMLYCTRFQSSTCFGICLQRLTN